MSVTGGKRISVEALCWRRGLCFGIAVAYLSFSIWYAYHLTLRAEQCCIHASVAVLDTVLTFSCHRLMYVLLLLRRFALEARIFGFTLVMKPIRLIHIARLQRRLSEVCEIGLIYSWPFGCFLLVVRPPCLALGGVQLPLPVLQWS